MELVASSSNGESPPREIILYADHNNIVELPNSDSGYLCDNLKETREQFSRELFKILGPDIHIYKIPLSLHDTSDTNNNVSPNIEKFLRKQQDRHIATLYDLHFKHKDAGEQIKYHCICLTLDNEKKLRFAQLTDTHLARRNDLIEMEISIEDLLTAFVILTIISEKQSISSTGILTMASWILLFCLVIL